MKRCIAVLLGVTLVMAQDPAPPGPVIKVTVSLVQIDAVVTGAKGNHVSDLNANDFEILQDGRRQTITHFTYVPGSAPGGEQPLKKPGAYQMRAAVRDALTAKVGSASQFIDTPDLAKGRLALSSIILSSGDAPEDGNLGQTAVRVFPQGARIQYAIQVLNARTQGPSGKPKVETHLVLYRDGKAVYTGPAKPLEWSAAGAAARRLLMSGDFQLGPKTAPGEYALEMVVTDRLAGEKRNTAAQWIDFEIAQ